MPAPGLTRRHLLFSPLLALPACHSEPKASWDAIVLRRAIAAAAPRYVPEQALLRSILGPGRRFHTHLREVLVHPTRDSLEYALLLLAQGPSSRAVRIVERVLALQVVDATSPLDGLWGYYAEEPPARMRRPDPAWAAWIASLLVVVARHHPPLAQPIHAAVCRAAGYLERLAEPLEDDAAAAAACVTLAASRGDCGRLAALRFDDCPTPALLAQLARLRVHLGEARASQLERRAWLSLAERWDAPRRQFAGPFSHSSDTDLGYPLWLEKSLQRRLLLATPELGDDPAVAALDDFRCPADLLPRFLLPLSPHERRDPHGVTCFTPAFSLASAARSDFYAQRRPLLAYFGDATRPPRRVRLRVVKDGSDFSSALFCSTQSAGRVLGLVNFRSPGGDRHPTLDPLPAAGFPCGRLFVELDFDGLPAGFHYQLHEDTLDVASPLLTARFALLGARFGSFRPRLVVTPGTNNLTVTLDFHAPRHLRWRDVGAAYAAFSLELGAAGPPGRLRQLGSRLELDWNELRLRGLASVTTVERHLAAVG